MPIYYAETGLGCCLEKYKNIEAARKGFLREAGTRAGVQLVRKATKKDISWIQGMGGRLPKKVKEE